MTQWRGTQSSEHAFELLDRLATDAESSVAAARVKALLRSSEMQEAGRQSAYCELLSLLLERLAGCSASPAADTYRAVARMLEPPLEATELEELGRLLERVRGPSVAGYSTPVVALDPRGESGRRSQSSPPGKERDADAVSRELLEQAQDVASANDNARTLLDSLTTRLQLADSLPEVAGSMAELRQEVSRIAETQEQARTTLDQVLQSVESMSTANRRLGRELQRVRVLSLTDENTGLPNRRAFSRQLTAEMARVDREGGRFSVALLDLDLFKNVNDAHGHGAGDEALRYYAEEVLNAFRAQDMVARYGGEEFAIILPGTGLEEAWHALAKAQRLARLGEIEWQGHTIELPTFSAGLVAYSGGETGEQLMHRADRALYAAKGNGRDRIELGTGESYTPHEGATLTKIEPGARRGRAS